VNLAFLLHLYQPPTQTESAFKVITQECYNPLVKLIKSHTEVKFTLNCPLSLLEHFDRFGYHDLLKQLKDLGENERVEFTGSAAYHSLLPKISKNMRDHQVLMNEYGLGYYLGQRTGFEGENSVMVKGIRGFFAPELALKNEVATQLGELGYEWIAADETALQSDVVSSIDFKSPSIYELQGSDVKLVIRDTALSNMISFKRDGEIADVIDYLQFLNSKGTECVVVALDGEVFGHHNPDGIYFLENLLDALPQLAIEVVTVNDLVNDCHRKPLDGIRECTWSSVAGENEEDIYPFWSAKNNKIQKELWALMALVDKQFGKIVAPPNLEGYENIATWKTEELHKIANPEWITFLETAVLTYKAMHSDQLWWASGKTVYDKVLYSTNMVAAALTIYKKLAADAHYAAVADTVTKKITSIETLLAK
jgi:alpha-amylase/alpha-mannosidase (GH57 family)